MYFNSCLSHTFYKALGIVFSVSFLFCFVVSRTSSHTFQKVQKEAQRRTNVLESQMAGNKWVGRVIESYQLLKRCRTLAFESQICLNPVHMASSNLLSLKLFKIYVSGLTVHSCSKEKCSNDIIYYKTFETWRHLRAKMKHMILFYSSAIFFLNFKLSLSVLAALHPVVQ